LAARGGWVRTGTPPVLSSAAALLDGLFEQPAKARALLEKEKLGVLTVQPLIGHGHGSLQVRDSE